MYGILQPVRQIIKNFVKIYILMVDIFYYTNKQRAMSK